VSLEVFRVMTYGLDNSISTGWAFKRNSPLFNLDIYSINYNSLNVRMPRSKQPLPSPRCKITSTLSKREKEIHPHIMQFQFCVEKQKNLNLLTFYGTVNWISKCQAHAELLWDYKKVSNIDSLGVWRALLEKVNEMSNF
jgi:hypothetical protein